MPRSTKSADLSKKKLAPKKETVSSVKSKKGLLSKSKPAVKKINQQKMEFLKILFIAPECAPFAKVGGLGDMVAGLSKALSKLGHQVRIVLPLYPEIDYVKYQLHFETSACVHMGQGEENWIGIHSGKLDNEVPVWFIDYGRFFGRYGFYGDYSDNAFRYGLFSKAALQLCKDFDFIPDVMHLHDWPAAPAAAFLKTWDLINSPLSGTASVLTIHNIGHQGVFHASAMSYYGLGSEHFTPEKFEDHGKMNLLKAGIYFADALTTVSPTHARELLEPIGGKGLAPILDRRKSDLTGILNGIDIDYWNPQNDPFLPKSFSPKNLEGKAACKKTLQGRFGIKVNATLPLIGIISRFAHQKGFELLQGALPLALRDMNFQLVVLGSGDHHTEDFFNRLHAVYPERVGVYIGFSEELSHLIEAGSDFFLMPSLYEPCGLNQMYSLQYGTLPIVRSTGGLEDTVENYDEKTGNGTGFKFIEPTVLAVYNTIGWAISTWFDRPKHIVQMQDLAMKQNFSWEKSAQEYCKVYAKAISNRRR